MRRFSTRDEAAVVSGYCYKETWWQGSRSQSISCGSNFCCCFSAALHYTFSTHPSMSSSPNATITLCRCERICGCWPHYTTTRFCMCCAAAAFDLHRTRRKTMPPLRFISYDNYCSQRILSTGSSNAGPYATPESVSDTKNHEKMNRCTRNKSRLLLRSCSCPAERLWPSVLGTSISESPKYPKQYMESCIVPALAAKPAGSNPLATHASFVPCFFRDRCLLRADAVNRDNT